MTFAPEPVSERPSVLRTLRDWLLTGFLVLAPSAVTLYVFFRLLNAVDNLLGSYLRFAAYGYNRIPGLGLLATLALLTIVGAIASQVGVRSLGRLWDRLLLRIPGINLLYGSTKSLGQAFLSKKEPAFKQVVLVPWPHPGTWRVGFITGRPAPDVKQRLGQDVEVVFVPHTPNPASGFVHYFPRADVIRLDWPIEVGLQMIISAGVVQPGTGWAPAGRASPRAPEAAATPGGASPEPPGSAAASDPTAG